MWLNQFLATFYRFPDPFFQEMPTIEPLNFIPFTKLSPREKIKGFL